MAGKNVILEHGTVYLYFIIGPNDPQCLATYEWDVEKAQEYLEKQRKETGLPITLTQLVGYCAGHAFKNEPDVNGRLSFGNVGFTYFIVLSKRQC